MYSALIDDAERWFLNVCVCLSFRVCCWAVASASPNFLSPASAAQPPGSTLDTSAASQKVHAFLSGSAEEKNSFLSYLNSRTEELISVFNGHLAQLNPNPGLLQV